MNMDREMIDKIRRHQGQVTMHKIDNDEFPFKPLGWEYIDRFFLLGNKFEEGKAVKFDDESVTMLKSLLFDFVKNSWEKPVEMTEDAWDDEIKSFCAYNMVKLMDIMFKLHNFEAEETATIKNKMEEIQKAKRRMEEIRAGSAESPSEG